MSAEQLERRETARADLAAAVASPERLRAIDVQLAQAELAWFGADRRRLKGCLGFRKRDAVLGHAATACVRRKS